MRECNWCGKALADRANYCQCGAGAWRHRSEDFVTHVKGSDMEGILQQGLTVETGNKALLFEGGQFKGTLEPGQYQLSTLGERIRNSGLLKWLLGKPSRFSVLVADCGDVELEMRVAGVTTADPLRLDAVCRLVLRLDDPAKLHVNLLKAEQSFEQGDLRGWLYPELRDALSELLRTRKARELDSDRATKDQLQRDLEAHLGRSFERVGLRLVQVRTAGFRHEGLDERTRKSEETWLALDEKEQGLADRRRFFDVHDREQQQAIFEETAKLGHARERNDVRSQWRRLVSSDKLDEIKSKDDFEAALLEIDKGKMIREDERAALVAGFEEKGLERDHLLDRVRLAQQREIDEIQRATRHSAELDELQHRLRTDELDDEAARKKRAAARAESIEDTKTDVERERLEHEQEMAEAKAAQDLLFSMKEGQLRADRGERELEQDVADREHARELEKVRLLNEVSIEVLMTQSGPEQAAMLKELAHTKALEGRSAEEILALAAKDSPEVARAFAEKWKGASESDRDALYERMLADRDRSSKDALDTVKEMFREAMGAQRDVGMAAAGRPAPGGGGSSPASAAAGAAAKVVVCTGCRSEQPVENRRCGNCGAEL